MARTFRRKQAQYHLRWVLHDWQWVQDRTHLVKIRIDEHSPEGRKLIARYRSDAGFGDMQHMTAPHWYRRSMNKQFNQTEKQQLSRWLKYDSAYEVPLPRRVRNASWYW